MDLNPNHFPTLLFICILMSILLYVISNVIYFFHQRKNAKNVQASVTNGTTLNPESVNEEEEQMANYLRDHAEM